MSANLGISFLLVMSVSFLGFAVSGVLYFLNRDKSLSPRLLAGILFCIAFVVLNYGLVISKWFLYVPHLYRTPIFFTLSMPVLAYIYVRSLLNQEFRLKKTDVLLFLPALLYTLSFIPFYFSSTEHKLDILQTHLQDRHLLAREPEGMLPQGWGISFRTLFAILMSMAQFRLLWQHRKRIPSGSENMPQNQAVYHWLVYFTLVLFSSYLLLFAGYLFQLSQYYEIFSLLAITSGAMIFFICVYLLVKPNILYGLKGWTVVDNQQAKPSEEVDLESRPIEFAKDVPSKRITLTAEQGESLRELIEGHFDSNKPFTRQGYNLRDLAMETGVSTWQLSAFINQYFGKNFNEFINDYRVTHILDRFQGSEADQFTLEALGKLGGFNSRKTFIAAFKRKTGKTPSEIFRRKAES